MDPLSDVLSLLKPRSYKAGGINAGGDLCVEFPAHEGIKCYAVVSGEPWLAVDGVPDPVPLSAGDCFLLTRGRPFRLASDLSLPAIDALTLLHGKSNGGLTIFNGGGKSFIVGGHFILDGKSADILLSVLPPIVHIRKESDRAVLRWCVERMMQELQAPQAGGFLVVEHLAHMMLVQALRLHLAEGKEGGIGWLFALADPQMAVAIAAMHGDPAFPWTLQTLAERAGMSRTSFALKFKATVGASPIDYLTRWRMLLAGERLMNAKEPVSTIALSLGYESESAFSTAFRRVMGRSPRQYGSSASHHIHAQAAE
jgi:AraC-like DNA-binding protein